ncbi:TonB system transport protein ExbD [Poseidonibacter lekithochrous]|uniref:TonB system transport protein ExbD n=1 Tax=Poseidonibacter TaxID=2321187 RepID=UPI001C0A1671|nr:MULTISPECIES: TonB system transport protein ExbD [Poseidonibacter]MBU3014744.1 TonB system transport protein ExbD [Poseidonibacter lekithochrous]MDO6828042.1 TonB system transport protein ExbD [Poseidonibacter sp. 1_MG-2023]
MKLKKFESINVIPFIDVLLVLLTIVLLTSTFISKGIIPVSLPSADNADDIKVKKEVVITITKDNTLHVNKEITGLENIQEHILSLPKDTPVHINSDKDSKFETFVNLLDMLKKHDYSNVSIVTEK